MSIDNWLKGATHALQDASIDTAQLDAEILLADLFAKDRAWIFAHGDCLLSSQQLSSIDAQLSRRTTHEPLAYIRGHQEFYGRTFFVDKAVLIPRPESEAIIDLFKTVHLGAEPIIADVGCGSGALGITAWLEHPTSKIHFMDIDPAVFVVTKQNTRHHRVRHCHYYAGNLLEASQDTYDVLLCNLPYVPTSHDVNRAAQHEPTIALFSGADGLDHYRLLFRQLSSGSYGKPTVITESFPFQHKALQDIARTCGWEEAVKDGFAQLFMPIVR